MSRTIRHESGPRRRGAGGVLALTASCALAAAVFVATGDQSIVIVGSLLLVITLIGGALLARFVARHGAEIGEARFDTSNKSSSHG